MALRIGFLHTASVHEETFASLLTAVEPTASGIHVVDESLLTDARAYGPEHPDVVVRVGGRLREAAQGGHAVLCTCSTVAGVAEALAHSVGVPVVRVDRPMATEAVRGGSRIGVVFALQSTAGPTRQLLEEEATSQHRHVELVELSCTGAWASFESGDLDRYLTEVARFVDAVAPSVDVIVLAQASMAGAAGRCTTSKPVLESPRRGVIAVVDAARSTCRSPRLGSASTEGDPL